MRELTPRQINQRLLHGMSYSEAMGVPDEEEEFNKYANIKVEEVSMANGKRLKPEEINRNTFRWRTKDKEVTLDEMDVDFKLVAMKHALSLANENHAKYNNYSKKAEKYYDNTKYFMALVEVLEDSLVNDHNLQPPSRVEDLASMRRMIKEGVIKVDNYKPKAK